MALMGRVVGVGTVGDPGGDIVMAAILSFNFTLDFCLVLFHDSKHLQGPKPVDGRRKNADAQKAGQSKRSPLNRVIRYDTWATREEDNFIRNVETKSRDPRPNRNIVSQKSVLRGCSHGICSVEFVR
jgi:hypothetical protein